MCLAQVGNWKEYYSLTTYVCLYSKETCETQFYNWRLLTSPLSSDRHLYILNSSYNDSKLEEFFIFGVLEFDSKIQILLTMIIIDLICTETV